MTDLRDKRVLITGAGHGLGRELAKTFSQSGCEVIVTDRDADRVSDTVDGLRKSGACAFGYAMDVTRAPSIQDVHDRLHLERGPIDILVNNAGIVCGGTFENVPLERHKAIYEVNCLGPVTVTHALLPGLLARPESHIVNIASASALLPLPYAATYASSKWAVLGFSESLREAASDRSVTRARHLGLSWLHRHWHVRGREGSFAHADANSAIARRRGGSRG